MEFSKEEVKEWKANPVTREVVKHYFQKWQEEKKQEFWNNTRAIGKTEDHIAQYASRVHGYTEGLEAVINFIKGD